jgi:hypothetical protein
VAVDCARSHVDALVAGVQEFGEWPDCENFSRATLWPAYGGGCITHPHFGCVYVQALHTQWSGPLWHDYVAAPGTKSGATATEERARPNALVQEQQVWFDASFLTLPTMGQTPCARERVRFVAIFVGGGGGDRSDRQWKRRDFHIIHCEPFRAAWNTLRHTVYFVHTHHDWGGNRMGFPLTELMRAFPDVGDLSSLDGVEP